MDNVAIFGVGLIGGSFALALKKAGFRGAILGVSSPATLKRAMELGAIDRGVTPEEAAAEAGLIYLSQPVGQILETLGWLRGRLRPGALVTDAGSTKRNIVAAAAQSLGGGGFLGGHPLAGKESRGVNFADAALFQGRTYVLTPSAPGDAELPSVRAFVEWIRKIGAQPVFMDPARHDWIVAHTSHLPQILSTCLSAALSEVIGADVAAQISGPALADSTRLALSPFEIWSDILATNGPVVREALDRFLDKLTAARDALDGTPAELRAQWDLGAEFARELRKPAPNRPG